MNMIKRGLAVSLAVLMLVCVLAACGGSSANSAAAGTYRGLYTQFVGEGDEPQVEEEFSLDLTADGKGVHHRDDMDFNVTWKLDGENFSMSETFIGDPIEYTGTLKDGKLEIFNGDPEDEWTCKYVYEKQS